MQNNIVQIDESLTAGIDLDMVLAEYAAIEKVQGRVTSWKTLAKISHVHSPVVG